MNLALPEALCKIDGPPRALKAEKTVHPLGERAVILVVDDENGPRQSLRMVLKEDYEVRLAESVDEALALLEELQVNLIISDIRMPRRTGIDLLRAVRERHKDIEVILLTGYGELSTAMEAMEYGAFAYLEKPFDQDALLEKIGQCMEKQSRERERSAMERLAFEANQFSMLGRMISGTMHDLGTPLSVLSANLEMLLYAEQSENTKRRLCTMRDQILHCTDLVRTAMNFLRQPSESTALFNVNSAVEMCLDVARPVLRKHAVPVRKRLATQLPSCSGDVVLVRQAVLNLIYNACQAMHGEPEPRRITIETRISGNSVLLAVEDTGPGVPFRDRERIFDSLYSTKGKEGTGLGLTVVRNVMQRHGGTARLAAPTGRGARFELLFPPAARE